MLYELIAIVRPGSLKEVKDILAQHTNLLRLNRIAKNAGVQVLRSGGVVRGYTNWGTFTLPKP
ncbi:hypothetical protein F66182_18345, partial [Fusarium sp. NRRL 66182]